MRTTNFLPILGLLRLPAYEHSDQLSAASDRVALKQLGQESANHALALFSCREIDKIRMSSTIAVIS